VFSLNLRIVPLQGGRSGCQFLVRQASRLPYNICPVQLRRQLFDGLAPLGAIQFHPVLSTVFGFRVDGIAPD
jgi:hypothetical protein